MLIASSQHSHGFYSIWQPRERQKQRQQQQVAAPQQRHQAQLIPGSLSLSNSPAIVEQAGPQNFQAKSTKCGHLDDDEVALVCHHNQIVSPLVGRAKVCLQNKRNSTSLGTT